VTVKNLAPALLIVLFSCGTQAPCDAMSCATGCCDSNGTCRPGDAVSACGKGGAQCASCTGACVANVCQSAAGGGSGGGTAASGGGSAANGGGSSSSGGGSAASGGGTAATGGGSGAMGGGTGSTGSPVLNEMVARGGNEYVEIYNPGAQSFDLSGYAVTDSHADGGLDMGDALHFPSGTSLPSHGFLLLMLGRADAGAGATTNCAGGSSCWQAAWSISNSKGETVWILDPQSQVFDQVHYPIDGADAGRSYGRLPDGTGAFQETSKTPGAPNMP
jgi:hypothetical protein